MARRYWFYALGGGAVLALTALAKKRISIPMSIPLRKGKKVGPDGTLDNATPKNIVETPEALASAAGLDTGTYIFARGIGSEGGSLEQRIQAAWVFRNNAARKGKSVAAWLAPQGILGQQGGKRPASTARPPYERDVAIARHVMGQDASADPTGGATRYLDVETQRKQHEKWKAGLEPRRHKAPEEIIASWTGEGLKLGAKIGERQFFVPSQVIAS